MKVLRATPPLLVALLLGACATPPPAAGPALPTARVAARPTTAAVVVVALPTGAPPVATPLPPPIMPTATPIAAPAPPTQPPTDDAGRVALLVAIMNQVRAESGLPPYADDPALSAAAQAHSCELASLHVISHTSADGRTVAERIPATEPPWVWPSESIAAGSDDPAAIVAMWMDEPPDGWHRRNILDPEQQAVGAGYCHSADDPTGNHHYWVAVFARH